MKSSKEKSPDILFETKGGRKILLTFEKVEYRAYELRGGAKIDMKLGSSLAESLKDYITERW